MDPVFEPRWDSDIAAAEALQKDYAKQVIRQDAIKGEIKTVAGVDVAYGEHELYAAAVVLDAASLQVIETVGASDRIRFPYVPGLFSFRELPPIVLALAKLSVRPDLIVCDGQGLAHPRRFGLACHLGLLYDMATIGCGKTRLLGTHEEPGQRRGDFAELRDGEEVIGSVLRTQDGIKPLYVSIGHRMGLASARDWILRLASEYRQPETTRQADGAVNQLLREAKAGDSSQG